MKITFAEEGWKEYLYWQTQDRKTLKRINQLLQSIERDGALQGIGKPELLKYGKSGSLADELMKQTVSYMKFLIIKFTCIFHGYPL